MVEIWAGNGQTVPEAHLGSAGASPIAPGAQIASRRAAPSRLRRSSSPTQMPSASARTASSTSSTSCLRPVVPRDCYRTRPEAGQRKAGAIFRGGGLAVARHMYLYLPKRMIQIRRSKHRRLTSGQECESGKHASARAVFFSKIR